MSITPRPDTLLAAELLRDGGSLCAAYLTSAGQEQRLILPVIRRTDPSGTSVRVGFSDPVLLDLATGVSHLVPWSQAVLLIVRLQRLEGPGQSSGWLCAMREVGESQDHTGMGVRLLDASAKL